MSRRYSEQVEVRLGEPLLGMPVTPPAPAGDEPFGLVPTAFIWRGRLHVVREVLDHWTQRLPWWRLAWSEEAAVTGECLELEQQVWRVEASPGRLLGTGVYDLTRDGTTRDGTTPGPQWRLVRVAD